MAILLLPKIRSHPWFSAYILFDVGRSLIVFLFSRYWPGMLADKEYCWIFTKIEWPALVILCLAAVEATPGALQPYIGGAVVLGSGAVIALLAHDSRRWPVWVEPAFAGRVWIDSVYMVCTVVRFPEQNLHGLVMYGFLAGNCIAYGSLILFHPGDTTVAACFSLTCDAVAYAVWGVSMASGYRWGGMRLWRAYRQGYSWLR